MVEVNPEQSKPNPDRPAHRYGTSRNFLAKVTRSAPVGYGMACPSPYTSTSLADNHFVPWSGVSTRTASPTRASSGRRVFALISMTLELSPGSLYSHVLGA